jgi:hypothetical protein
MFVSRAAARRRLLDIRAERYIAHILREEIDRRIANALLYGTSHPEAYINNGDPDDRKA